MATAQEGERERAREKAEAKRCRVKVEKKSVHTRDGERAGNEKRAREKSGE